jgi:hypothetical protein
LAADESTAHTRATRIANGRLDDSEPLLALKAYKPSTASTASNPAVDRREQWPQPQPTPPPRKPPAGPGTSGPR